jgi:hypothetical protein
MASITYAASPSTAQATDTFYTLKGLVPDTSATDVSTLSTVNYPPDRIPLQDAAGYDMPNPTNQIIFKNQPVSWWIAMINAGSIKYTPVSNTVNWAYVDAQSNVIHIHIDISIFMIPNRTDKVDRDTETKVTTITLQYNGVMNMTQAYSGMPF